MVEWIETYRGVVNAWECDIVEHFTIGYYFERFADATRNFLQLSGCEALRESVGAKDARLYTSFAHELRAGAGFHMLSAVVGVEEGSVRLGHRVVDSARGTTVTWVLETLPLASRPGAELANRLAAQALAWPGPDVPQPTPHAARTGALTSRDRVKTCEIGEDGTITLAARIHRFSGAGMQYLTAIGMTAAYMHENRRGFSTLALDLRLKEAANAGERIDIHTSAAHLGNTSLSYVHRMTGADGREIASLLQAGVHLDLDARRPTAIPSAIREAVTRLLAQR
jgi:acyl-CoA thioesterase FadM